MPKIRLIETGTQFIIRSPRGEHAYDKKKWTIKKLVVELATELYKADEQNTAAIEKVEDLHEILVRKGNSNL